MRARAAALAGLLGAAASLAAPAAGGGSPGGLAAQELAERVRASEGRVAFRVALRDGVQVCEDGVTIEGDRGWGRWHSDRPRRCSSGEAEVLLRVRDGRVEDLELEPWAGEGSTPRGGDLGRVSPGAAANFLTGLAGGRDIEADREAAEHGMMASVLLKDVEVWPALLETARDRSLDDRLRRSALFWTSQVAARAVTEGIRELAGDDSEDQELRDAAVFALSQRPSDEAVPALVEVARTAPHGKTRKSALFWLAQHDDPRVVAFFEEILRGG